VLAIVLLAKIKPEPEIVALTVLPFDAALEESFKVTWIVPPIVASVFDTVFSAVVESVVPVNPVTVPPADTEVDKPDEYVAPAATVMLTTADISPES